MATLINGNGNPAIYAGQDADLIAALAGNVTGIAQVGNKFVATAVDANTISVADGVIITKEGRRIQLDAGSTDAFTIPTGTAGTTNYYIIGYLLTTEADSSQVAETFVQLMDSSTATIEEDTFRSGATDVYVSLYRVEQDGVNLGTITGLLPELNNIANSAGAAEDITYDNTSSGLTADNVQEAIDEINDDLSDALTAIPVTLTAYDSSSFLVKGDLYIIGDLLIGYVSFTGLVGGTSHYISTSSSSTTKLASFTLPEGYSLGSTLYRLVPARGQGPSYARAGVEITISSDKYIYAFAESNNIREGGFSIILPVTKN